MYKNSMSEISLEQRFMKTYNEDDLSISSVSMIDARTTQKMNNILQNCLTIIRALLHVIPFPFSILYLGILTLILVFLMPKCITYMFIYPTFRLLFGTLYPAYASYKAIRTKNLKQYVKWMMYWIVFAIFTTIETFADVFCSFWFPFYYEIKVIIVIWMLSPTTKGSSVLYRRFVHPALLQREGEIDEALAKATEQGYTAVLDLGTKGINYATTVLLQTAIKVTKDQSKNEIDGSFKVPETMAVKKRIGRPKSVQRKNPPRTRSKTRVNYIESNIGSNSIDEYCPISDVEFSEAEVD